MAMFVYIQRGNIDRYQNKLTDTRHPTSRVEATAVMYPSRQTTRRQRIVHDCMNAKRQLTVLTSQPAPQHCVVCGYNILTDRLDVVSDPEASSD